MARKYHSRLEKKLQCWCQIIRRNYEKIQVNVTIKSSTLSSNLRPIKISRVVCQKIIINSNKSLRKCKKIGR